MELIVAESAALHTELRSALDTLWDAAFDDFTAEDANHAFGGVHVLAVEEDRVLAHGSVVPRRLLVGGLPLAAGYVEGVATLPERQGSGLGSRVMAALAAVIRQRHDLGALSTGAHGFYERRGW